MIRKPLISKRRAKLRRATVTGYDLIIAAVLALMLAFPAAGRDPAPSPAEPAQHQRELEGMRRLLSQGRAEADQETLAHIQEWVDRHPNDSESLFLLSRGLTLQNPSHYDETSERRQVALLRRAAAAGRPEAMAHLGWCLVYGSGTEKDEAKGMELIRQALAKDDAEAHIVMADVLHTANDRQPEKNDSVIEHLRIARNRGVIRAGSALWIAYQSRGEGLEHFDVLRESAELGDAKAQAILRKCYTEGFIVPRDLAAAERWGKLAAQSGNATYQLDLAQFYLTLGKPAQAKPWLQRAVEGSDAKARYLLGMLYIDTSEVDNPDMLTGLEMLRDAAEDGQPDAEKTFGDFYLQGLFVDRDHELAKKWYEQASKHGSADAEKMMRCLNAARAADPRTPLELPPRVNAPGTGNSK